MNLPDADGAIRLRPRLRSTLQLYWETAQGTYVLRSPGDIVELNPSAAEILLRCDGIRDLDNIITELEDLFGASDLAADVYRFIEEARQRGWLD